MSVDTNGLVETVRKLLHKQTHPLVDADTLYVALKAKLTKKELKILLAIAHQEDETDLCRRLKLDRARYETLRASIEKKLNSETFKQRIYVK